jgi:putative metallohydrolase (TIGR04338 family)
MSDVNVSIYRVDRVTSAYARTPGREFKALHARYTRLIATQRFRTAFPRYGEVQLLPGNGGGSYAHYTGHSQGRVISLGSNLCEAVLLHEIAHHVARRHREYGFCTGHGPGFALALLHVVKVAQGLEAERALRHAYKALRIRVYRAGQGRGVLPRVAGEMPERAQEPIAKMLTARDSAATERAAVRAMLSARPEPGKHEVPCGVCGESARLSVHQPYGRKSWDVFAECGGCDLSEWIMVSTLTA